mmetsp:Transcript_66327/g.200321  ORF Transcript_66327/g.200321 Transcript_66327/m.200321 type:complete len:279 (-) Transcript_66327:1325-2161(-)
MPDTAHAAPQPAWRAAYLAAAAFAATFATKGGATVPALGAITLCCRMPFGFPCALVTPNVGRAALLGARCPTGTSGRGLTPSFASKTLVAWTDLGAGRATEGAPTAKPCGLATCKPLNTGLSPVDMSLEEARKWPAIEGGGGPGGGRGPRAEGAALPPTLAAVEGTVLVPLPRPPDPAAARVALCVAGCASGSFHTPEAAGAGLPLLSLDGAEPPWELASNAASLSSMLPEVLGERLRRRSPSRCERGGRSPRSPPRGCAVAACAPRWRPSLSRSHSR